MPQVRFILNAWGHQAGDVVEFAPEFAQAIVDEKAGVIVDAEPKVERAVAQEPGKETATVKR